MEQVVKALRDNPVRRIAQDFSQPDSLTNRCGQGEHTRHEVQALVNGGEAKAGTSWKDWPELEQDERIGVGLAAKHSALQGGKGIPPRVYHYKRAKTKPKPKPAAAAGAEVSWTGEGPPPDFGPLLEHMRTTPHDGYAAAQTLATFFTSIIERNPANEAMFPKLIASV